MRVLGGSNSVRFQATEWEMIYKGPERRAKQLKQEYKDRGYFTRLRRGVGHFTLEVAEAKDYNLERKPR